MFAHKPARMAPAAVRRWHVHAGLDHSDVGWKGTEPPTRASPLQGPRLPVFGSHLDEKGCHGDHGKAWRAPGGCIIGEESPRRGEQAAKGSSPIDECSYSKPVFRFFIKRALPKCLLCAEHGSRLCRTQRY